MAYSLMLAATTRRVSLCEADDRRGDSEKRSQLV